MLVPPERGQMETRLRFWICTLGISLMTLSCSFEITMVEGSGETPSLANTGPTVPDEAPLDA